MSDANPERPERKEEWLNDQWKSQVKGDEPHDESPQIPDEKELQKHDVPLPAPTLISLASGIAAQAMVSMGVFPNPMLGKPCMLLNQAKHLVDTVEMLFEKTKGNQTSEETKTLENVLHELRMLFVAAQNEKNRRSAE
ncbi:MAG: DUF1844 domain-containing protein [Planctomycetaceae bacterium]|nr:DUF1844 domain-containing protein [Planctomycetaceae bacterium]